jgi:hypothetical protein
MGRAVFLSAWIILGGFLGFLFGWHLFVSGGKNPTDTELIKVIMAMFSCGVAGFYIASLLLPPRA